MFALGNISRGVLLGVAALGMVACTEEGIPESEHQGLLQKHRSLQREFDELEKKLQAAPPAQETEAVDLGELVEKIDQLSQALEEKDKELEALKTEFREYKGKYRASVREKIVGKEVARLETLNGVLEEVIVNEVTSVGLRVSHRDGVGRVRFDELSEELQDQLGYDEEEAAEQLAAEVADKKAADQSLAENAKRYQEALAANNRAMVEQQNQATRRQIEKLRSAISSANARASQLEREARNYQYSDYYSERARGGMSASRAAIAKSKQREAETLRARGRQYSAQIQRLEDQIR